MHAPHQELTAQAISDPGATLFRPLPGGRFEMGSLVRPDEQPIHQVTIGPFEVAVAPVSNAQFAAFLDATRHEPPRFWDDDVFNAPTQPVVGVSWFDAVDYCTWLSELLGRSCRLPSEAEREYAARGGLEGAIYPWGDTPWTEGPFAPGARGTDRPLPIGSTPPNGFGLYHMGENVHEWCLDWYDPRGYVDGEAASPGEPEGANRRASRGGSWRHHIKVSRIAARSSLAPDRRYNDYGMRVYADAR
jgi:formylglycine-generating enzyme required for sulfatase activity